MYYNSDKNILISKSFKTASSTLYEFCKSNLIDNNSKILNRHRTFEELRKRWKINETDIIQIVGIRNPWDYVASAYHWSLKNKECPSNYTFNNFLFDNSEFNWQKQLKFWNIDEIDDVVAFEDLENEIQRICIKYGLASGINKPIQWRKRTRNSNIDYKDLYKAMDEVIYIKDTFYDQIEFFKDKFNIKYTFNGQDKYYNSVI